MREALSTNERRVSAAVTPEMDWRVIQTVSENRLMLTLTSPYSTFEVQASTQTVVAIANLRYSEIEEV